MPLFPTGKVETIASSNPRCVSGMDLCLGSTATYTYDALNHRVQTKANGATTEFVFNINGQRVSEWNWNGTTASLNEGQYYWGSKPVAFYTTSYSNDGATVHYQHQDWLGTERIRTDDQASVEASFTSLPFGDAQTETTSGGIDLDANHYAMLDYDSETNTDHAQFRQYSSTEGRWMRPDTYSGSYHLRNPQSFNRYSYVMNNPLSRVDPSGLDWCDIDEGGFCDFGGGGDVGCYGGGDGGFYGGGDMGDDGGEIGNEFYGVTLGPGAKRTKDPPTDPLNLDNYACIVLDPFCAFSLQSAQFNQQAQAAMHPPAGPSAPSNAPNNTMPKLVCGVEGCQAVSGKPVVIPNYVKCVGVTTVAGGTGGFFAGVAASWFTAGTSIGAATIVGAAGGFGTGLVACIFYN